MGPQLTKKHDILKFGTVWRAIVDSTEPGEPPMQAAVKALTDDPNQEQLDMFHAEAVMMAHLDHPHVVDFAGSTTAGNPKYIIMHYCDNGSLNTYLHGVASMLADVTDRYMFRPLYTFSPVYFLT